MFDRYLATQDKLGAANDPEYASALADSASPLLKLRRTREALARLERAVALLPVAKGNLQRGAKARFALADALWASGGDRARARSLALEASATARREKDAGKIDAWLLAHPAS